MKYLFILFLTFTLPLGAKMLISPFDAMTQTFGKDTKVSKKNILLKSSEAKKISQDAKVKLKSKIFRIFIAKKDSNIIGYGILVNRKVRSKNAVVLYMITKDSILKSIEIIAFNEPNEYIPSNIWMKQFKNISTTKKLRLNKNIPTITGATLSAKSIVDGSRIAFALYHEVIKK